MAATILDTIAAYARDRVATDKASIPPEAMADMARQGPPAHGADFEQALRHPGMSFICAVKRPPRPGVDRAGVPPHHHCTGL